MLRNPLRVDLLPLLLAVSATALAQRPVSGPPKGANLAALRVLATSGDTAGTEFDAAAELARGPAAILFVHELSRNTAPVLRAFDDLCADLAAIGLRCALVRLAEDRTEAETRLPTVARALWLQTPLLLSTDGAEGPGGYALNRRVALTLVVALDGKVVESIGLVDTGHHDVELLEACLLAVAGTVPDAGELRRAVAATLPHDRTAAVDVLVAVEQRRRALAAQVARLQQELAAARQPAGRDGQQPAMAGRREGSAPPPADTGTTPAPSPPANLADLVRDAELGRLLRALVRQDADDAALDRTMTQLRARLDAAPQLHAQLLEAFTRLLADDTYGNAAARARMRAFVDGGPGRGAAGIR